MNPGLTQTEPRNSRLNGFRTNDCLPFFCPTSFCRNFQLSSGFSARFSHLQCAPPLRCHAGGAHRNAHRKLLLTHVL